MSSAIRTISLASLLGVSAIAVHGRPPDVPPSDASVRQQHIERLKKIVLPEIQFREANLADVIDYLSRESARLDPGKRGVNFVLMNPSGKSRPVTMHLQNVPLSEAVRFLAEVAGVLVRVDKYAVVFHDPDAVIEQRMETRVYPVSAGVVGAAECPPEARRPQLGRVEGR